MAPPVLNEGVPSEVPNATNVPAPIDVTLMKDGGVRNKVEKLLLGPCRGVKHTTSCPPGRGRSGISSPWSLKWVNTQKFDGVSDSLLKNTKVLNESSTSSGPKLTKKKGAGYLRHTAQSMRRIARLPAKDREEVLCALKRNAKGRTGAPVISNTKVTPNVGSTVHSDSQVSVNNEWSN